MFEEEDSGDSQERHHGLSDDKIIYVYDDYIDDYYAYHEKDPDPYKVLPLTSRKVLGFMLSAMGTTLAAGGGIGGEKYSCTTTTF